MQAEIVQWETDVYAKQVCAKCDNLKGCVFCQVQAIVRNTMA